MLPLDKHYNENKGKIWLMEKAKSCAIFVDK